LIVSVEPAVDFGNEHGHLIVTETDCPDQVVIEQADRVIYVLDAWIGLAAAGQVPWASITWTNPWHVLLKIRGTNGLIVYDQIGTCGPRVQATLFRQPD
jgi:hypothetical protein